MVHSYQFDGAQPAAAKAVQQEAAEPPEHGAAEGTPQQKKMSLNWLCKFFMEGGATACRNGANVSLLIAFSLSIFMIACSVQVWCC